ncbi:protein cordon-bleu [Callorhinchus milii]|uniref:protein cordon-bleu n=1 Tax=Callorhinchus milii TaxID=7868 RepID=UPI001C3FE6DB|nr:protein cordon-bleu [Callorhinchus milii]
MKGRAPAPPPQPAPRRSLNAAQNLQVEPGPQSPGDMKENLLPRTVDILVVLSNGTVKKAEVSGSKAVMDLLIDLCSQYHLNPAHHILELQARETHKQLGFKPNTPIGVLDVEKVFIKQKVVEEKPRRPPPVVPEKTVRLVVNFLRTQKAVVRVSPFVPLKDLVPVICEKCEFDSDYLMVLRDSVKREKLDLLKSLNDLGIRELYALDTSRVLQSQSHSVPSTLNYKEMSQSAVTIGVPEREEKGLFGFFKIGKKKTKGSSTAPCTPTVSTRSTVLNPSLSASNISKMPSVTDVKKRRAPPPPPAPPQQDTMMSVAQRAQETGAESLNSAQKKRRAPAPPDLPVQKTLDRTEFDKSSSLGVTGRQVPLKPPRGTQSVLGNQRSPPQLTIPPPPPYPPSPTIEITDLPGMSPKYNLSSEVPDELGKSMLELEMGSEQDSGVADDIMEIESGDREETASVKSSNSFYQNCSQHSTASEDDLLNVDSGTPSSPSIASPASLTGSLKWSHETDVYQPPSSLDQINRTEECSAWSIDLPSAAYEELSCAGKHHTRLQNDSSAGSNSKKEDEIFIAAQMHQTVSGLNAELDDIQEESALRTSFLLPEETNKNVVADVQDSVPVTNISEAPSSSHKENERILLENVTMATEVKRSLDSEHGTVQTKSMLGALPTRIQVQPLSEVSSDLSYLSAVRCTDTHKMPIKTSRENLLGKISNVQNKPSENKIKMPLPDTDLKSKLQFRENNGNKVHDTVPAEVDPLTVQAKHGVQSLRNSQADRQEQVEKPSAAMIATECKVASNKWQRAANKIANQCVPKVGMRTFKVIPSKPILTRQQREGKSLSTGAIKIDDQGNLVYVNDSESQHVETASVRSTTDSEESLLGRAKAFWNVKGTDKDNLQTANPTTAINTTGSVACNLQIQEPAKQLTKVSSNSGLVSTQPTIVDRKSLKINSQSTETKPPTSVLPVNVAKASTPANTDSRAESNFLKPYRRTSSQYVASAICRYTGMQSIKAGPNTQCDPVFEIRAEDNQNVRDGVQKSFLVPSHLDSIGSQVNSGSALPSNWSTVNLRKVNNQKSVLLPEAKAVPDDNLSVKTLSNQKRPLSFPNFTTHSQLSKTIIKETVSIEEQYLPPKNHMSQSMLHSSDEKRKSSTAPTSQTVKTLVSAPAAPTSGSLSRNVHSVTFRSVVARQSAYVSCHPSASHLPAVSPTTSSVIETPFLEKSDPPPDTKQLEFISNSNMFGPVKKFKSVIQKPVQKDESIHSSLMEAIQSGKQQENLRKVSDTLINANLKKPSFIETENGHSALLASIRAHTGVLKLNKTSGVTSEELVKTRAAESSTLPREFSETHKPENSPSTLLPPPPPPPQAIPKTQKVTTKPNANPEQARSALLDAIRSGTGAARLRKVPVPSKTVQVNGSVGSIQALS